MIDKTIAIERTYGFEDPSWRDPVNGGKPESDPIFLLDGTKIPATARFGLNSYYNPALPIDFFDGTMLYAEALARANAAYTANYWLPFFDELRTQDLANNLYDMEVNPGSGGGARIVQICCVAAGQEIAVDGAFGPATLAGVNRLDPVALLAAIRAERWAYYGRLVVATPAKAKNLPSWKQRTFAP